MNNIALGFELMAYGLSGVFIVLIIFYIAILILQKLFH